MLLPVPVFESPSLVVNLSLCDCTCTQTYCMYASKIWKGIATVLYLCFKSVFLEGWGECLINTLCVPVGQCPKSIAAVIDVSLH